MVTTLFANAYDLISGPFAAIAPSGVNRHFYVSRHILMSSF